MSNWQPEQPQQPQGIYTPYEPTVQQPTSGYSQPQSAWSAQPYPDPYAQQPGYPQQAVYPQQGAYAQGYQAYPGQPVGYGVALPGAPYGVHPVTGEPYGEKTKLAAGLLSLLIPGLGAGRFYTGHYGLAIAQIVVTVITLGFGAIWPFIDGIIMLSGETRDAQGRLLRPN